MVEVIRPGRKPEDEVLEADCNRCGARLRFKRSEGREAYDQREGGPFVQVDCPTCGSVVTGYPKARK